MNTESEYTVENMNVAQEEYYDILANQKITFRDLKHHLTGPVISIIFHIVIIALLSTIIVLEPHDEPNEIEVEMMEMEVREVEEIPPPPDPPEEVVNEDVEIVIERPDLHPTEEIQPPVTDIDVTDDVIDIEIDMSNSMLDNNSALQMNHGLSSTNLLGARNGGGSAPAALKSCIAKGLAWLAKKQKSDGTFPFGVHPNAKWGACTLAFLGSGNSMNEGKYKEVVRRSIGRMISKQGRDGSIGMHAHATPFIALALLDACALDPANSNVRASAQKILDYALTTQQNNGAWSGNGDANPKTETTIDITATGWWAMALISGRLAGLEVPDKSFVALKRILLEVANGTFDGKILVSTHGGTSKSYDREVTIYSTLLTILQFLGVDRNDAVIQSLAGKLHSTRTNFEDLNYWTLYKQGVGVFQLGQTSPYWFGFVTDVITKLVKSQKDDGSWTCSNGYGKKKSKGENGGSTKYWGDEGATAMAILNLQVYFRYGSIHDMYKRHGRLIPQKLSKGKSRSVEEQPVVDDVTELGIEF